MADVRRIRPLPIASARLFALVLPIWLCLGSADARAYEEQTTLELGTVFGAATVQDPASFGLGAELDFTWGLSEAWSIGGSLRYLWHHRDASAHLLVPALEATWQLDLVQWVPRIGIGAGPAMALSDSPALDLDAYLRLGIDRLLDSGLLGFDVRADVYGLGTMPGSGRLELSLVMRWGFVIERF